MLETKIIFKFTLKLAALLVLMAGALWLGLKVVENPDLQEKFFEYGYLGAFLIAAISGFNLLVPIPAITFLPAMQAAGLNYWLSIGVITLGMATGDSLGFLIGRLGRQIETFKQQEIVQKLEAWRERHYSLPYAAVFVYASIVPLPNEIIVIPMAFLGYRYLPLITAVVGGNLIFNTLTAYGITNLFELFVK